MTLPYSDTGDKKRREKNEEIRHTQTDSLSLRRLKVRDTTQTTDIVTDAPR